jgi:hypothetical protein
LENYKGKDQWLDVIGYYLIDNRKQDKVDVKGTKFVCFGDGSELEFKNGKWRVVKN